MARVPRVDGVVRRPDPQPARPRSGAGHRRPRDQRGGRGERHVQPRNQNVSSDEAMDAAAAIVGPRGRGLFTTLTLSTRSAARSRARSPPTGLVAYAARGAERGVDELCFGDTIGVGMPDQVRDLTSGSRAQPSATPRCCATTSTTRGTPVSPTPTRPSLDGVTVLDSSAAGSAAARSPRTRPATSRPTTSSTCSTDGPGDRDRPRRLMPTAAFLTEQLGHEVPAMLLVPATSAGSTDARRPAVDARDTAGRWTQPPGSRHRSLPTTAPKEAVHPGAPRRPRNEGKGSPRRPGSPSASASPTSQASDLLRRRVPPSRTPP